MKNEVNLIPNGDFGKGVMGAIPESWTIKSLYPNLDPVFRLNEFEGKNAVEAHGGGNPNCVGHLCAEVKLKRNETYKLKVIFHISDDINPAQNLMFSYYAKDFVDFNNGIFTYKKLNDNWVVGENDFFVPGEGDVEGEVRISFRLSAHGRVFIREINLHKTEPIPARPVKVACANGSPAPGTWEQKWTNVFNSIGDRGIDLFLLPEVFNDCAVETDGGPGIRFMAEQAKRYSMYVAGTTLYKDPNDGFVYNAAFLFDRSGVLVGKYYKNHSFSNELLNMGVLPGTDVPVFDTDLGKIGIMVCYDSWFTDVAELLALKGAEIILFPNAGYYRSLMSARAADNCVRIVASSLDSEAGIWDTSGADVACPNIDPTRHSKCDTTFNDVTVEHIDKIKVVSAVLDLSQSPSPHNWGGPMMSAPGGRRNRREQKQLLLDEIKQELNRWWS